MKAWIMRYLRNNLVALDQNGSALIAGDPDETISSRLGKAQRGDFGRTWQDRLTPLAMLVDCAARLLGDDWNHCRRNIEDGEGERELLKSPGNNNQKPQQ